MIPKITHQIFMQGFSSLPEVDRERILAFRERNPAWDHRFYDQSTAEAWLRANADERTVRAYYRINPDYYAARADLLRYLLCSKEGGLYLDVKSEARRPLDDVLHRDDSYLLSQWPELRNRKPGEEGHPELAHIPGDEFVIWFIASMKNHPFLRAVIEQVLKNIENYNPWRIGVGAKGVLRTTGPVAYTLAIHPILNEHACRFVDAADDLGFYPFRHGDFKRHRGQYGRHYSVITDPVINGNTVTRHATRAWFGYILPELRRAQRRFDKLGAMIMGRGHES